MSLTPPVAGEPPEPLRSGTNLDAVWHRLLGGGGAGFHRLWVRLLLQALDLKCYVFQIHLEHRTVLHQKPIYLGLAII